MHYDVEERWKEISGDLLDRLGLTCVEKHASDTKFDHGRWAVFVGGNVRIKVGLILFPAVSPELFSAVSPELGPAHQPWSLWPIDVVAELLGDKWVQSGLEEEGFQQLSTFLAKHWVRLQEVFERDPYPETEERLVALARRSVEEWRNSAAREEPVLDDVELLTKRLSPSLLTDLGLVCVEKHNTYTPQNENPWATFVGGSVRLKLEIDGWALVPELGSAHSSRTWFLTVVAAFMGETLDDSPYAWVAGADGGFRTLSEFLTRHWSALQQRFGADSYIETDARLAVIHDRMSLEWRNRFSAPEDST